MLSPCPWQLNCVCSQADSSDPHYIAPFEVSGDPASSFAALKGLLAKHSRTRIATASDTYIHATCRTRLGFIDDVECRLCPKDRLIHVRSASRLGIWDLGVNRRRIETLRNRLRDPSL